MKDLKAKVIDNWKICLILILIVNFILRIVIFYSTSLFSFSDYQAYLIAVEQINEGANVPLLGGNYLFTISYLGYFAKYVLGSIDYFFLFNCAVGTITTYLVSLLTIKMTGRVGAGLIAAAALTVYTEFMAFSSVFYSTVIMLFLLSCFMLLLFRFVKSVSFREEAIFLALLSIVYLSAFLFKPEMIFLPFFLIAALIFVYKQKPLFRKTIVLIIGLSVCLFLIFISGIYDKQENEVIANDFIFFGHTDYGGNGGEGAFVYDENRLRYQEALGRYLEANQITSPDPGDINRFQAGEIKIYLLQHPVKWMGLQFKKFARTFGVVPETTSFKVLYTGLFKENLWLTSFFVVAPVAIILLLLIIFFKYRISNNECLNGELYFGDTARRPNNGFFFFFLTILLYYIFISVFLGQYQERYRLPAVVVFLVPLLAYSVESFDKKQFLNKSSIAARMIVMIVFLAAWVFQAGKALADEDRLANAIELIRKDKR
jgi:hypothetical protein